MRIRYMFLTIALLFCAIHVSRAQVENTASAERYIKDSEAQWAAAEVSGDTTLVGRIVAEDFVGVAPDGTLYNKAEAIAEVRDSKGNYVSNHLTAVNVRFYGDTAVAQGSETWERRAGDPKRGRYVWTDTWIKRDYKWQIVAAEDLIASELKTK